MLNLASLDPIASHRTAENTQTYMLDGWMDWIGYLRTLLPLEHLAVLINHIRSLPHHLQIILLRGASVGALAILFLYSSGFTSSHIHLLLN